MLHGWNQADGEIPSSPMEFAWGDEDYEEGWGGSLDWSDEDLDEDDLDEGWDDEDEDADEEEDDDEEWAEWGKGFEDDEDSLGRRRSGRHEWN